MEKAGLSEEDARVTADVLVTTDTWGVHTHGTKQLRGLLKNFRDGKMDLTASRGAGLRRDLRGRSSMATDRCPW